MSWNQAGGKGAVEAPEKKARLGRWLATTGIMIAVLAGGAVYFLATPEIKAKLKKEKGPAKIAEAQADLERQPQEEKKVEETKPKKKPIPEKVKPDEHGVLRWPSGAVYFEDYGQEKETINPYKGQKKLFKHGSEVHIATLLTHKPGNMIIGGFEYGEFFDRDLKAALEEEIEFLEDDTEEERELKADVIAVKQELKEAIARGEKPSEIMQEAREELVKQFQYKQNLAEQLAIIQNDEETTTQDMIDATEAANIMLEREGLESFPIKTLIKRRMRELQRQ